MHSQPKKYRLSQIDEVLASFLTNYYSPGCVKIKESGFFTDLAGCNLCIFVKNQG